MSIMTTTMDKPNLPPAGNEKEESIKQLEKSLEAEDRPFPTPSAEANDNDIDDGEANFKRKERRVVAKLDLYLCPIVMVLQMMSFLDRGNIGYAATQGMTSDLGLDAARNQLNTAVSIFYPLYILVEVPAALVAKRLGFDRVIAAAALGWGVVCLANGMLTVNVIVTLLMANWYKREEIGLRVAYLFIASSISSAFGGLIAFGILFMDGTAGYPGWRWLYIIEGSTTIAIAITCYFAIPSTYTTAYFLTEEDKSIMRRRAEQAEAYSGGQGHYTRREFVLAVRDIKTWLHVVVHVMSMTVVYAFTVFLPVILRFGFDLGVQQSQYLCVPVFLWGSLATGVGGYLSDRYARRFLVVVLCTPLGVAGYAILVGGEHLTVGVKYFACFLVASCLWMLSGGNLAWLSTNTAPDGKRAASVGLVTSLANVGGIISGQIYPQTHAPGYTLGHAWSLGALAICFCLLWVIRYVYIRREVVKEGLRQSEAASEPEEFSDRAPGYKYQH